MSTALRRPAGLDVTPGMPPAAARALWTGTGMVLAVALLAALVQRYDAALVLAGLAAAAAGVVLLVKPELATLLTIFLLYVNFPAILTKRHGVPHVVAGSFILLLAIPLVYHLLVRRRRLRVDAVFGLMLALLAVSLVSSLVAVDAGVALDAVREYALEGLLLYWLVFNAVRGLHTLRRAVWTLLLAGGLLSGLSLYQTATGTFRQEFGGLAYRNYEASAEPREPGEHARRRTWNRAQGPVRDGNRFAQILIVLVPLAAFAYRNAGSRRARLCAAGLGLLILTGVVLTLSRGGYVALVLLCALMLWVRWIRVTRLAVFALVVAAAAPAVPFFAARVESVIHARKLVGGDPARSREIDTAALGRATVMLAAVHTFLDHPLVGVGPGQFPPFYSQKYSRDPRVNLRDMPPGAWRAHSLYLEIGAETGALGLGVFLSIVVVLVRRLWRARRAWAGRSPERADLATAFCLSVLAYQFTGLFLHLSFQPYYWFLLAMAGATLHVLRAAGPGPRFHGMA